MGRRSVPPGRHGIHVLEESGAPTWRPSPPLVLRDVPGGVGRGVAEVLLCWARGCKGDADKQAQGKGQEAAVLSGVPLL